MLMSLMMRTTTFHGIRGEKMSEIKMREWWETSTSKKTPSSEWKKRVIIERVTGNVVHNLNEIRCVARQRRAKKKRMRIREIIKNVGFFRSVGEVGGNNVSFHFVAYLSRTLCELCVCVRISQTQRSIIMIIAWVIISLCHIASYNSIWMEGFLCWQDNSIKCASHFLWPDICYCLDADRFSNHRNIDETMQAKKNRIANYTHILRAIQ